MPKFKLGDRVKHIGLGYKGTIVEDKDENGYFGARWDGEFNGRICHDPPEAWELIETDWDK